MGEVVLVQECVHLFSELLPSVWEECLSADSLDLKETQNSIKTLEDYFALTNALDKNGWIAFVADGSDLPSESGVSNLSLKKNCIAFLSPDGLRAEVDLPHKGKVSALAKRIP